MTNYQKLILDEHGLRVIRIVPLVMKKLDSDDTTVLLCAVDGAGAVIPVAEVPATPEQSDRQVESWTVSGMHRMPSAVDPWFVERMCEKAD